MHALPHQSDLCSFFCVRVMAASPHGWLHRFQRNKYAHVSECTYKNGHPGCSCRGTSVRCPAFYCHTPTGRKRPIVLRGHQKVWWRHDLDCIYLAQQLGAPYPSHPGCTCDSGYDSACPADVCTTDAHLAAVMDQTLTEAMIRDNFDQLAAESERKKNMLPCYDVEDMLFTDEYPDDDEGDQSK